MALTKSKKSEVFKKVEDVTKDAQSLVFVNFHGLKVADATDFRRALKAEGVGFVVAKKTITKKVLDAKGYEGSIPELSGEVGLAYGTDLIAPARGVYAFQKKLKNNVAILGGVFEGKYMTKEEMTGIATIPSREALYSMFLNVINSPIQGLAVALSKIAEKKIA